MNQTADNSPQNHWEHPRDAIVRVTRSCICGSNLHLYHGMVSDNRVGQTFGYEFVGINAVGAAAVNNHFQHFTGVTIPLQGGAATAV